MPIFDIFIIGFNSGSDCKLYIKSNEKIRKKLSEIFSWKGDFPSCCLHREKQYFILDLTGHEPNLIRKIAL